MNDQNRDHQFLHFLLPERLFTETQPFLFMTSLTQHNLRAQIREKKKSHILISFEILVPITVRGKDAQTAQLNIHSNDAATQKENLMADRIK